MTELNEENEKEIDSIFESLETSKIKIEKKFRDCLDEYIDEAFSAFWDAIEIDQRYDFKKWVIKTCDEIIERLLMGDEKWLKDRWVISDYSFGNIKEVRTAILNAHGEKIKDCELRRLTEENQKLREDYSKLWERSCGR